MITVGVDLGGTFIKAGLVDDNGKILHKSKVPTRSVMGAETVVSDMGDQILSLLKDNGYTLDDVRGIGVGSPGAIDSAHGIVNYSNNLRWKDVALGPMLEKKVGKPVKVSNDANVAALGETVFGVAKGYSDTVLLTLGTGVGGGIIIGGKLFEGNESKGAELGHSVIVAGGEPCTCGRRGCLEAYASATALIRETKKAMQRDTSSAMWNFAGSLDKVDGRTAFECAKQGDPAATEVVNNYLYYLCEGILNYCNVFRPQAVILGGGVCAQGEYLLNRVREIVVANNYGFEGTPKVDLLIASLGNDAGLVGAASLILTA